MNLTSISIRRCSAAASAPQAQRVVSSFQHQTVRKNTNLNLNLPRFPPILTNYLLAELACECAPGYRQDPATIGDFFPTCVLCGAGEGVSLEDRTKCMPCDTASGAVYDRRLKDCTCPELFYVAERDVSTGELLAQKTCLTCTKDAYQGPDTRTVSQCAVCPVRGMEYNDNTNPYRCECSKNVDGGYTTAGDICILDSVVEGGAGGEWTYAPDRAGTVSYSQVERRGSDGEVTTAVQGTPR